MRIVPALTSGGVECWGLWVLEDREIRIAKHHSRGHMWSTLFHEMAHAALDDSGLSNVIPEPQVEAICDAIATARMRERFG